MINNKVLLTYDGLFVLLRKTFPKRYLQNIFVDVFKRIFGSKLCNSVLNSRHLFSRVFDFANFFQSRKTRKLILAKISENKVR